MSPPRLVELGPDAGGQLRRDRLPGAGPVRHDGRLPGGFPHVGHESPRAHELQRAAGEREMIARPEPGDEVLLDRAERAPPEELDLHRALAHDGADRQPMAHGGHAAPDHVAPVLHHDLAVFGVRAQRVAAVGDEIEHPRPLGAREIAEGVSGAHLVEELVGQEAAAEGHGDRVLRQQIQRPLHRPAGLDPAGLERVARGGHVHQLQRVRRDAGQPAHGAGLVAAPARALDQPPDGLGASDLEHAIHRREVDAEVEGRRADDASELAVAEPVLDPFAGLPVERAVVKRHDPRPVGPGGEQRLVPDLGRGAGVREDERGLALLDGGDDLGQEPEADLPGPREALHRLRNERIDLERLGNQAPEDMAGPRRAGTVQAQQRVARHVEISERGGEPEHAEPGPKAPEARQGELGLHAALGAQQLVPLVDDGQLEMVEQLRRVIAREQERQALGRRDERGREPVPLARADAGRGIAGAGLDGPRKSQVLDGRTERRFGVGRERPEGSDPEDAERWRPGLWGGASRIVSQPFEHRPDPRRVGLAGAGGRVDQAALTGEVGAPGLLLEREGTPVMEPEPLAHALERVAASACHAVSARSGRADRRDRAGGALSGAVGPALRGAGPAEVHRERAAAATRGALVVRAVHDRRWRGGSGAPSSGRPACRPTGCCGRTRRHRCDRTRTAPRWLRSARPRGR